MECLHHPDHTDKAHFLGYKAKKGYVVASFKVRRVGQKIKNNKGMVWGKLKHQFINNIKFKKNLKLVAEERVGRKFSNLRVLNLYRINQDATMKYYDAILVKP